MSAEKPAVSVIIPVHNGAHVIRGAVASIVSQTTGDWELIIVDDGSTDSLEEALRTYRSDRRIRIARQANAGPSRARNFGVECARGNLLAFLDADDRWMPDYLKVGLATAEINSGQGCLVYSRYTVVDAGYSLMYRPSFPSAQGRIIDQLIRHEAMMLPSNTLLHRAVWEKVGGFPAGRNLHEDRVFFLKACNLFPAFPTNRNFVIYCRSGEGGCRKLLSDYPLSVARERNVIEALQQDFCHERHRQLEVEQMKNLLVRFVMNGHLANALRLSEEVTYARPRQGLRGWLARASLISGVNLLVPAAAVATYANRICFGNKWIPGLQS